MARVEGEVMLGENLGSDIGQITNQRVLPFEGGAPRIEATFEANGTILGVQITDLGTFVASPRPDGNLAGEGQGIVRTEDGEVATWTGGGVGRPQPDGSIEWRGCVYYQTTSAKLARLNNVAALFEFDVDASGKTEARLTEWK
jgi:hypothetical protein